METVNRKKVFVTGASGFLGSSLVKRLAIKNQVHCLTNRSEIDKAGCINEVYTTDDISEFENEFIKNCGSPVIHAATSYGLNTHNAQLVECNITMPLRLARLAAEHGRHFLNVDSYFSKAEFDGYEHLRDYISSKKMFKYWARHMFEGSEGLMTNCMVFHMFGKGDKPHKFTAKLFADLKANKNTIELTEGSQERDFIYVEDVVDGILACLSDRFQSNTTYSECELGNGKNISVREFAKMSKNAFQSKSQLLFGAIPSRNDEITPRPADFSKNEWLNWRPKTDLVFGIKLS